MDLQTISGFFMQGDMPGAVKYMQQFPELKEQVQAYLDLFEKEHYLSYDVPAVLQELLLEYQRYFRDVFWLLRPEEDASGALLERLAQKLGLASPEIGAIDAALKEVFAKEDYHIQPGKTNGHYGPYVWKETAPTAFEVELPEGVSRYTVNFLRGFVMRSWMDYLTFGEHGTDGWAGEDGVINCIEKAYDLESDRFRVSLLKHEAQHVMDMARWPEMPPAVLEYRAKLVELIYITDAEGLLAKFLNEASSDRPEDGHALASARIAEGMGDLAGGPAKAIHDRARELFEKSSPLYLS